MKIHLTVLLALSSLTYADITPSTVYSVSVGGKEITTTDEIKIGRLFNNGDNWLNKDGYTFDSFESVDYTIIEGSAANNRVKIGAAELTAIGKLGTLIVAGGTYTPAEGGEPVSYTGGNLLFNTSGTIANDIIVGSTIREGGDAIEFYNDKESLKLIFTGTITLVNDATFSVSRNYGSKTDGAYLEGGILATEKTLTLTKTNTLYLSGGGVMKTLAGAAAVVLDDKKADGTTEAASKEYTMTNATGDGTLTIDNGVVLNLMGHATDATLQTTSKGISNSGTIKIGASNTQNKVILTHTGGFGKIEVVGNNTLSVNCEGNMNAHFDLNGQNSVYSGRLEIGSNAKVTADTNLWFNQNGGIDILSGGQLTRGSMVINTQEGKNASIRKSGSGGVNLESSASSITMTNVDLAISSQSEAIVSVVLVDRSLGNNGQGIVRENNSVNKAYISLEAKSGDFVFAQKGTDGLSVETLTLAIGRTLTTWVGSVNQGEYSIVKVTDVLSAGTGTTITSDLVLSDGVLLDLEGSITLNGALTFGSGLKLEDGMLSTASFTLFTGVSSFKLGDVAYSDVVDASTVFTGLEQGTYNLVYADNKVSLAAIPEPATATLSLLALAALAARRRRSAY